MKIIGQMLACSIYIHLLCQQEKNLILTSPSVVQVDFTHKYIFAPILNGSLHASSIFWVIS